MCGWGGVVCGMLTMSHRNVLCVTHLCNPCAVLGVLGLSLILHVLVCSCGYMGVFGQCNKPLYSHRG